MLSIERLEEMRQNELVIVQRPFVPSAVRRVSEDHAEALGELIELRKSTGAAIRVVNEAELWGQK